MGDSNNITLDTLAKAAIASDMNATETINNTVAGLNALNATELEAKIEQLKQVKS